MVAVQGSGSGSIQSKRDGAIEILPLMTIGPRMILMLVIAALAVSGMLTVLQRHFAVTPRGSLVAALHPPYEYHAGFAWRAVHMLPLDLQSLLPYADDPKVEGGKSPVVIYEDGKALGPAHSNFAEISKLGHGRFTWWIDQGMFFSTSDGSDPNSNGRRYWAVVP